MRESFLIRLAAIVAVALAAGGMAHASTGDVYRLVVHLRSGVTTRYLATDEPRVSLSADGTVAHLQTNAERLDIAVGDIDRFTVEAVPVAEPTAVALPGQQAASLGTPLTLAATLTPADAVTTLTWESSDPGVAAVDADGTVTPHATGEATITVRTDNGLAASCRLTVVEPQWRMFVWETSGQRIGYDLEERPEVALDADGTVTLTTTRTIIHYEPATVEKLTLNDIVVDDITVGMADARQPILHPVFQAGDLTFDGLAPGTLAALYDASGRAVAQTNADAYGQARLATNHLPTGVYIVRAGTATLKISKR